MRRAAPVLLLVASLVGTGCGDERTPVPVTPAPPPAAPPPAPAAPAASPGAAADLVFATRCALCHGAEGHGNGPGAAALDPKPRDYRDAAWQASVTDAEIQRAILEGGAAVAKSPAMPAHPDLGARPEVLAALVAKIRAFRR